MKRQLDSRSKEELSSNLQSMKFMQRGKEAEVREKLRLEREDALKEAQWVANEYASKMNLTLQDDSTMIKNNFGRRSFGAFNKEVEVLHKQKLAEQRKDLQTNNTAPRPKLKVLEHQPEEEDKNADIDAAAMAQHLHPKKSPKKGHEPPFKKPKV